LKSPLIRESISGWNIHYDVFGLTYWMLTRQEEVGRTDLDLHGRFPATSSHAYKYGYLERPIVDEWLFILAQVIKRTWPKILLNEHKFNLKVSHDVDVPSRFAFKSWLMLARALVGDVVKRRNLKNLIQAPMLRIRSRHHLHFSDPENSFEWIMDVSERYGLCSAFYFICGRTNPKRDADYEPDHPAILDLIRRISLRGHEIGLHPSYESYRDPAQMRFEADRLKKIAEKEHISQEQWGGRMHYLRWEHPTTLKAICYAGLSYDCSLGYADQPGFRCGTCFEYDAFDPLTLEVLPLRIRPLIAMDTTLLSKDYLGLDAYNAYQKLFQLMNKCIIAKGTFSLLWHNCQFINKDDRLIYEKLLQHSQRVK
jgi:hypothetical protein